MVKVRVRNRDRVKIWVRVKEGKRTPRQLRVE